jgi:HAD superfamily hydrolase (TIGR01509 family)
MNSFKILLSDLDGVIRLFPALRDREIEKKYSLANGAIHKVAFESNLLNKVVTGKISDKEWREEIVSRLGESVGFELAQKIVCEWSDFSGVLNEPILEAYSKIASHQSVMLLSNATDRLHTDLQKLGIHSKFQRIFNSSDYGYAKPEEEIYKIVLRETNASPDEILFIDDSESNVRVAKSLGFQVHHFKNHTDLEKILETTK